ncbi:hypothetical protein VE01_04490 [Pseudogymnoascus verrucosus]|uniref:Zn(2)-C6 fungal-type domain-containing protein n=1 Tax=Pseudogymnoascus verrucosus TaxID=342668 RepID=A0A1B8GNZ8_9PEZI|nr:uncharacterized protein VE01_04490 [Pseudogymnoascus verrucosus]OBT97530.1 hypothetical protein VE01_04490 [Pseudogymnoascus verrucosus]
MAGFSSYIGQFRAEGDGHRHKSLRNGVKRNRPRLSCAPCCARKLKCDRGRPCEKCVKRNDDDACTYDSPPETPQNNAGAWVEPQEKLLQLEKLVMQLMESESCGIQRADPHIITRPQTDDAIPNLGTEGHLHQDSSETRYSGSTHWSTILDNIQELKTTMDAIPSTYTDHEDPVDLGIPEGQIIFGSPRDYSMQQILSESLPPRAQVDRYLSAFFKAQMLIAPYIHIPQFQRQYEDFWKDPLRASPLWVSIMFSLCCMSAKINELPVPAPSVFEGQSNARTVFLNAAGQCLVLGEFTRPQSQVMEALGLYAQCKYMFSLDPSRELCIILGVLSRLAYMMGYHRDPDNFGNFTIFEGEMRRRVWSACRQFDLMVSFQFGLHSCIPADSWDSKAPRNLLDSDFNEETSLLPLSRPQTDPTPILYFVVKDKLLSGFTKVCSHALSLKVQSQEEILDLDAEIRQMYSTIPESLRIRPMEQSLADPPFLIISRIYIEFLHQKSLCILHRRHMALGFEYSTKACVNAAMTIITYLIGVNKELQPGGQLYANSSWALTSFNMNDFLLAVMILCLSLSKWKKQNPGKRVEEYPSIYSQLDMLRKAYAVCVEKSAVSKESRCVVSPVKSILSQFETEPPSHTSTSTGSYTNINHANCLLLNTAPSLGTNGITSLSLNEPQLVSFALGEPTTTPNEFNPFEDIFGDFENVDWTYLSQYLVGPNMFDRQMEHF